MSVLTGCQEGKATPKLVEVKCPKCGKLLEIFVRMGGAAGSAGRLSEDAVCECGYVAQADTPAENFKPYDD